MDKGRIKTITGIIPPTLPRVEHEVNFEVQDLMERFEKKWPKLPALSKFDLNADPITNFRRVVLKQY